MSFLYVTGLTMAHHISPLIIVLQKVQRYIKTNAIWNRFPSYIKGFENRTQHTSIPSGKQRQKKSGLGLPTPFFIASVKTAVINTANNRPALVDQYANNQIKHLHIEVFQVEHKLHESEKWITKNAVVKIIHIFPTRIDQNENGNRNQNCIYLIIHRKINPRDYI